MFNVSNATYQTNGVYSPPVKKAETTALTTDDIFAALKGVGADSVTVRKWNAIVTPKGVWIAPADWQSMDDFSQDAQGLPESTMRELEYLSKMLQHIPPLYNRLIVIQSRNPENPNGVTTEPPEIKNTPTLPQHNPKEALHAVLYPIANAFAAVSAEATDQQYAEAAFRRMIANTNVLSAHIRRIGQRDEVSHEEALAKVNAFADTFLEKFRQYGLQDGFNVAWVQLYQSANTLTSSLGIDVFDKSAPALYP
ncbi:MAG: hypothetical protein FWB80_10250 [Defluviitaleaceae bacterium]|nr:hypothetical protein [Defluviitaleaceae bacterium]MCL2199294.1 hypothetical protein [Defluviitaleaceae bacterium]